MDVPKSINEALASFFPSLDPNGQPYSVILRGTAAELDELRSTLTSRSRDEWLQMELQRRRDDTVDDRFGDGELVQDEDVDVSGAVQGDAEVMDQGATLAAVGGGTSGSATLASSVATDGDHATNKRGRDDNEAENEEDDCEEDDLTSNERLLLYLPSVQCTCTSWEMDNVEGDLLVTSLRVLFVPPSNASNDIAIDGRCISLHAVDSLPSSGDGGNSESHVYCQLSEPMGDGGGMGCASTISMAAPTNIMEDTDDRGEIDDDDNQQEEDSSDGGDVDVYFKPMVGSGENLSQTCQLLFDSLTKLASLNPADDGGEGAGGGLFSMLAMMAGMGGQNGQMGGFVYGDDDEDDNDDMVIRFGGSNNLVEDNDDSDGAADEERHAMLQRLDGVLVVPPEYEIASSDEGEGGQFDDADDEIL